MDVDYNLVLYLSHVEGRSPDRLGFLYVAKDIVMIIATMNRQEVNQEIVRVLPDLMKIVLRKTKFRERQARKRGYPDEVSSYDIEGVTFLVFYFFDNGADVNTIFCRYHDSKGVIYAHANVYKPGQYNILHFLKHAIDQYNSRLGLVLDQINNILFYMAKHDLTMVRKEVVTEDDDWLDVVWKSKNGLWLGESKSQIQDSNTHVSIVRTFVNDKLVRKDQEAVLDDDLLEELIVFEENIGGDAYARRRVSQLIGLFTQYN